MGVAMDARTDLPDPALARLTQHRWGLPVMTELLAGSLGIRAEQGGGARLATLVHRLGAPQQSVKRALEGLALAGWVEANPGDGHPLRPEFRLTPRGIEVARAGERLLAEINEAGLLAGVRRKWSLPATLAIAADRHWFNDIKTALPGITPRALTMTLTDLESSRIVLRTTEGDRTPRPRYSLRSDAMPLVPPLARLNAILAAA